MRFALNDLFQTIYCATFGQPQGQDDDMLCPHLIAIGVVHKVRQRFFGGEGSKIEGKIITDRCKKSDEMGKSGVRNSKKSADLLYEWPHWGSEPYSSSEQQQSGIGQ